MKRKRIFFAFLAAVLITGTSSIRPTAQIPGGVEDPDGSGLSVENVEDSDGGGDTDDGGSAGELPRSLTEDDFRSEIDGLNNKLKDLKKQQDAVKSQIAGAQSEKEKKLVEKTHWEKQVQNMKDQISVLEERINLLQQEIEVKNQEITEKQQDIAENYDKYKQRMRATFMAGESSPIAMVMGASDFTDFLMRTEIVRSTAQHDKELLETLRSDRQQLEDAKTQLNSDKQQVESDKQEADASKKELEAELAKTKSEIQDIALLEQEYLSRAAELKKQDAMVEAELEKIYARIDNSTEYVGGEIGWPVPGFSTISSAYGWRFNNSNFHTGIDIAGNGIYGARVVAGNGGKVILAQNSYSDGVGYGRYVIIDHGGGKSTLYGHMSQLSVSEGQSVKKGQEIGRVGQTGWATGPHLHFEVRINGKHTNPMSYLKG